MPIFNYFVMTLQQLKYVEAVARCKNISKAAEAVFISQPSLTAAIHQLEEEMNIQIFSRTNKGVEITKEGELFLGYARQVLEQADLLENQFKGKSELAPVFSVSCQHYSFAVKSFVEMVKKFDTDEYEFSISETRTLDVITDVSTGRSEIGILYLSDFNRKAITKLLHANDLIFERLIICDAYVYVYKDHPLAKNKSISFEELKDYPCLTINQGGNSSFYFAEEILTYLSLYAYLTQPKPDSNLEAKITYVKVATVPVK